jgi:hypothetical protein
MLENLTKETFAGCVGETFRIHGGSQVLEVELIEVSDLDKEEPRPFSLLFRNPGEHYLPGSTTSRRARTGSSTTGWAPSSSSWCR